MNCANAVYRKHIVSGLFGDTLESAWLRAEKKTTETRRERFLTADVVQ